MANTKKKKSSTILAKGSMDIPFFLILMTIVTIGLVMLFSASYTYSYYHRNGDSLYIFKRQLAFVILGVICMYLISRIRYEYFRVFAIAGAIISVILLAVVLVLPEVKPGFKRWINLGFTTFQPSEIAKIGLILILAYLLEKNYKSITGKVPSEAYLAKKIKGLSNGRIVVYKSFTTVILYGLLILLFAGLIYLENHVSGTLLILAIGVMMMFLGEADYRWFVLAAGIVVAGAIILISNPKFLEDYAGERITAWLDKDYKPTGARWQTNNSLYAIGSGGFLGTGLGQSKQKHLYVSEPQNDFIFAIVCEELGFLGASIIIGLFGALVYRGIKVGMMAKDRFSALLCMGISFHIGIQVALNIAVVTDFFPNTGISLPFFSAGGTSVLILLCEMGMLLSVSRANNRK